MRAITVAARHELIGLYGVVERNWYLVKRYAWWELAFFIWTIANTLSIVFISKAANLSPAEENRLTTILLIGAVIWSYLGIIFEILTETVAWERWEGTIEYTFMAPLSRPVHLIGMGLFAVGYGLVRASLVFGVVAAFFGLHMPDANFATALLVLGIASVSFIGVGMMTAVLPLISPEKGTQLGFMAQGVMLVVSGVYYPVSVLPAVDAGDLDDLAGDLCATRDPERDPRGRDAGRRLGRHLAAAPDRHGRDPARALGLPARRALRQAAWQAEAVGMTTNFFGAEVAARYDRETADMPVEPVVDFLADAGGRRSGARAGHRHGSDRAAARRVGACASTGSICSPEMVAKLREKPGSERVGVTIGDFATTRVDRKFTLVYLVFNTIGNLTTQEAQVACFENVAAHLEPGGCFVIELRIYGGAPLEVFDLGESHVGVDEYDAATQRLVSHHFTLVDGGWVRNSVPFRSVSPEELDLMARLAGMRLRERWAGWAREPFTAESTKHVSVWELAG